MFKVLIAGVVGVVVAVALAVFGYQAGYFDSFRKAPAPVPQVVDSKPAQPSEPETKAGADEAKTAEAGAKTEMRPTFDVVRVEPTGDAVVAGLAEPDATVALVANGKVIGKTRSNASGEWAIVLDTPLAPGDYDVAIHAEKNGGEVESSQRVTVSIPKDKQASDVLVVMNAEGEPSTILQRPSGERDEPAVVASNPDASNQNTSEQNTSGENDADAKAPAGAVSGTETASATPETAQGAASPDGSASDEQVAAADTGSSTAEADTDAGANGDASANADVASNEAASPATGAGSSGEGTENASASGESTVAAAPESATAPTPGTSAETSSAGAEQAEGTAPETNAGGTNAGETVVADKADEGASAGEQAASSATGEASSAGSDAAAGANAGAPSAASTSDVASTDQATGEAGTSADTADATQEPASGTTVVASAEPAETAAETPAARPQVEPVVSVDAVESEKGKIFVAGKATPGSTIRVYMGSDYLGEATAGPEGGWLLETERDVAAGKHDVRADLVRGAGGEVLARAEVTFEREPDAVILTQVTAEGAAGEGPGASASATASVPNVIIRKGDNLWTISRRLYGEGIRYTTIYKANQKQIRNPDLIYPGQVFLTPVGDDAWKEKQGENATN